MHTLVASTYGLAKLKVFVVSVTQYLAHDDGALDGQFEVLQCLPDDGDDALHAVNLLPQEDVHGGQRTHLQQPRLHLYNTGTHDVIIILYTVEPPLKETSL